LTVALLVCCSARDEDRVTGPQQARQAVLDHLDDRIDSGHGYHVSPSLRLGADLEGFGRAGDPVWEVRRTDIHNGMALDGLFWVNGANGRIRRLYPVVVEASQP
jgi:hypothetical protein